MRWASTVSRRDDLDDAVREACGAIQGELAGERPDAFRMVQLAWPDPTGALPWEPAFAPDLAPVQLLLGTPPA